MSLIVLRRSDAARWIFTRLGSAQAEDEALSEAGLADWAAELDVEDRR